MVDFDKNCNFKDKHCVEKIIETVFKLYNEFRPEQYKVTYEQFRSSVKIGDLMCYQSQCKHTCQPKKE